MTVAPPGAKAGSSMSAAGRLELRLRPVGVQLLTGGDLALITKLGWRG